MIKGINNKLKLEQKEYIEQLIIRGHKDCNKRSFILLNNEAGMGKTTTAEECLLKAAMEYNKLSLLIRFSREDCYESMDRINKIAGEEVAFAYNTDTKDKVREQDLRHIKVLIITHERYKILSKNIDIRKDYTRGRSILIIDENIDIISPISINLDLLQEIESKIYLLEKTYSIRLINNIIKEIKYYFEVNTGLIILEPNKELVNQIRELKTFIIANFDNGTKELQDQLNDLIYAFSNISIKDNKIIKSFNPKVDYWGVGTNIILDACAHMNVLYKLDKRFKLHFQERVFDYSNWKFNINSNNSCRTSINKADNYIEELNNHIKTLDNKSTFIVTTKEFAEQKTIDYISKENIGWFGNIVGKNNWRELTNCYITVNPQMPFSQYLLQYLFYSKYKISSIESLNRSVNHGVYRFKDNILEDIRVSQLAIDIYQAVKRINRFNNKAANVYIINNDEVVLEKLLKEFKGYYRDEFKLDIKFSKTNKQKKNDKIKKENSYYYKFIKLLESLLSSGSGIYSKKELRESINCTKASNFSILVLNNEDVIQYLIENNIEVTKRNIIIPEKAPVIETGAF